MGWYCAKTVGREVRALASLDRAGIRAFRPEVHKYFTARGVEKHRILSLFPGYVFVFLENDTQRSRTQTAVGVAGLLGTWVGSRFEPKQMPTEWVNVLRDAGPQIIGKKMTFKPGSRVKLATRRLADEIHTVEAVDKNGKLVVNMKILGAVRAVEVDPAHVELVE